MSEPTNPYQPSDHDENISTESDAEPASSDLPDGYVALAGLASLICFPSGLGLWAIGREARFYRWATVSIVGSGIIFLGALTSVLLFYLGGVGFIAVAWVGGLIDTVKAKPGILKPRKTVVVAMIGLIVAQSVAGALARAFVTEAYQVPSGAMMPTLIVGDHITVTKLGDVKRGDVIVFGFPKDPEVNYVKRVIGMPGDTVEFRHNAVYINGEPLVQAEPPAGCPVDKQGEFCPIVAEMTNDAVWTIMLNHFAPSYSGAPIQVPSDAYFVLGDNRHNSHDSRYWGTVPTDLVEGVVQMIWWSRGKDGFRWERFGERVGPQALPVD